MPKNIITTPEQSFADELKKEIAGAKRARFAVGWFFISGLKALRDEIDQLDQLEILISPTSNRQTIETMLAASNTEEAVADQLEAARFLTPAERQALIAHEATVFRDRIGHVQPSSENRDFLQWLRVKLSEEKIVIRMYTKEYFHAKVYFIEREDKIRTAFVGSSNISLPGFTQNTEVNVRLSNEQATKLNEWFAEKWKASEQCKFTSLAEQAIVDSWVCSDQVTPFRLYLRILHDMFSIDENTEEEVLEFSEDVPELYPFQKDAVIGAFRRLKKYGGVFLADVPGVGKTYMGAALLAHLQEDGERAIVVCPPKIEEQWSQVLDDFNVNAKIVSRGKVGDVIEDESLMRRGVVLIDEAHYFRNPETSRYKDLQVICEGKKVILVGATPQNLSIMDVYHQLKLFHPQEMTDTLRIEPLELKKFFEEAERERTELDAQEKFDVADRSETLFQQVLIRRTRKNIIDEYGRENLPAFPKRCGPYRIDYSIDEVYPGGMYSALEANMDRLKFARYDIGNYIEAGQFTDDEKQRLTAAGKNLRSIMRMILFKLLESSIAALRESLYTMTRSHELFLRGLDEGKVLSGDAADKAYKKLKDDLDIEDIEIPEESYSADRFQVGKLRKDMQSDLHILREMADMVRDTPTDRDEKLQTLIRRIRGDHRQDDWDAAGLEPCEGKKVLIFTQYATTAQYIAEELKKHFARVECVSGESGGVLEKAARFSPNTESNRKYLKKRGIRITKENEIDILVSTELLGEGMNLQDGQVVINYELAWNPVRIIQRIGRIDRIGSKNERIWVYNFFPQTEAEARLGIQARIQHRMREIQSRFGDDEKTVSQDEQLIERKFYEMYSGNEHALEEDARDSVSARHRLNWARMRKQHPEEYSAALALPNMANCGRVSQGEGIAVYCRAQNIYKLYFAGINGDVLDENDWSVLERLQCGPDEKGVPILDSHDDVTVKVQRYFQERANEIESKRSGYLEPIKRQAIDRIEKAKRKQDTQTKRWMSSVQDLVRRVRLDIKIARGLRGIIRKKHGLTQREMVDHLEKLLVGQPTLNNVPIKKLYAEIVLSESLKS